MAKRGYFVLQGRRKIVLHLRLTDDENGEERGYPILAVVVLMPQLPLLDLVGVVLFIPIDITVGYIPHIVIPGKVSDIGLTASGEWRSSSSDHL